MQQSRGRYRLWYAQSPTPTQILTAQQPDDVNRNKLVWFKESLYEGSAKHSQRPLKVGIVGAGCAGLFTALIFDHLKETCELDVDYEILEANGEDRLGGRLYSYYFRDRDGKALGPHDYFDVGAMRFPKIKIMDRLVLRCCASIVLMPSETARLISSPKSVV